jgi:hypothetical protein
MRDSDDDTRGLLQRRLSLVFTVLASVALFYAAGPVANQGATLQIDLERRRPEGS